MPGRGPEWPESRGNSRRNGPSCVSRAGRPQAAQEEPPLTLPPVDLSLLSSYCVLHTVPGPRDTTVNKMDRSSAFSELTFWKVETDTQVQKRL